MLYAVTSCSTRRDVSLRVFSTLLLAFTSTAFAQGILTVTPSRSVSTTAGTGTAGYSGDGGGAIAATLAKPSAIAYDASGNLYIADANNHVIREVSISGIISTVAGSGVEGYAGDGAAATAAELDTPTGIAVDKPGNLYIADSHNQRIRMVSGGTITTIAGNGSKGYAGDGAAAAAASLALPSGVAVDASGNVYIADTDNHRIRKITSGTISTIAGDGEELFAGDGGAATSAALDSPTGVAVDSSGNVYIADRLNQRIREVSGGAISTIAGSGAPSFSGGFAGDGASPTAASLAKPTGVAVDSGGNIYIADTNNQVIRQIGGGAIASIAGSPGTQGFGGDGGPATSAILNAPKTVTTGASGDLVIADTLNQRVRAGTLPTLTFPSTAVGIDSTIQNVTLANTGTASITVSSIAFSGAFVTVSGGSCPTAPVVLAAGASCTENIAFLPAATGAVSGTVVFSGSGVVPQAILLTGTGAQATTGTILSSTASVLLSGQSVTLTATIKPQGLGTPTGTLSFLDGASIVGSPVPLAAGATTALLTTTSLPDGNNAMTAVYSGDANFIASTSNAVAELVEDFNLTLASANTGNEITEPGQAAVFTFNITPIDGAFNFPITLSATGLPAGASVSFNPATITPGSTATTFTMTVLIPATAQLRRQELWHGSETVVLALLLLPFGRRMRRGGLRLRSLLVAGFTLLGLVATVGLIGCGGNSGFFGQTQKSYTITVVGTATSGSATLQHSTTVTVTVE
jgi:sugar lactone lactonase YvrE